MNQTSKYALKAVILAAAHKLSQLINVFKSVIKLDFQ